LSKAARSTTDRDAAASLLNAGAVRERCTELLALAEGDGLRHFLLHPERLVPTADYVAGVIRDNYPDLRIPPHSRWRHFEAGGVDRWGRLVDRLGDSGERARARIDLAVVSVLLDAGAGPRWRYREAATSTIHVRSEGLAVASLALFTSGALSARPGEPLRVDAPALAALDAEILAAALQVGPDNPLDGLDGRLALLHALAAALAAQPALFGDPPRPGHLFDYLMAQNRDGAVRAETVLGAVLAGLGPIWPGRVTLGGLSLGDCWRHPGIRRADPSDGLIPFHKLSQWLSYSLIEPLEEAGLRVTELDGLTGLAEYRNGGLLIDLGVIEARDPAVLTLAHSPDTELVVEWRALTVALLDRLAPLVRKALGVGAAQLPLVRLLEGGTWSAGRRAARERRADGTPPLTIASDGTVF